MKFNKLNKENIEQINEILQKTNFLGGEYQHSYQRAWFTRGEEMCFSMNNGIIYMAFCCDFLAAICDRQLFLPPLTTDDRLAEGYEYLAKHCAESGDKLCVVRAPHSHLDALGDKYDYLKFTSMSEYIYSASDLIDLPGKKYHAKRNHIAKFIRQYNYVYRDYQLSDFDEIMSLYDSWSNMRDMNDDDVEKTALAEMLSGDDKANMLVGVLLVNDKIIAFACGEITANNVGIVHFEKADTSFDGGYAMINNQFSRRYFGNVKYVNRQEDMGIEGLQKAKLSYYPVELCDKWIVTKKRND